MSVPNSSNTATLSLADNVTAAGKTMAASTGHLLQRVHAAALRRLHLGLESAAAVIAAPDGTRGKHELTELSIASENKAAGVHFLSTPWAVLRWTHAALMPAAERPLWSFIDLGAGKGRAVLSAANESYKRVIGVEFAAELAAEARANVDFEGHDLSRVMIHEGDATAFALPDGPCVVFLFNPFGPPVLDRVVERIDTHARTSKQPVRVAYLNPVHAPLFRAHNGFRCVPLAKTQTWLFRLFSPYRLEVYETTAHGADHMAPS